MQRIAQMNRKRSLFVAVRSVKQALAIWLVHNVSLFLSAGEGSDPHWKG